MAGKDKTSISFRLYWDDSNGDARELSADVVPGSVSDAGGQTLDMIDLGGISEDVVKALGGRGRSPIRCRMWMNDTATTGATTVLKGTLRRVGTLTLQWGANGAAPTAGDPEWEGEYILLSNNITEQGGSFAHNCYWEPAAGQADPALGTVS
jgi:hypothetical protein